MWLVLLGCAVWVSEKEEPAPDTGDTGAVDMGDTGDTRDTSDEPPAPTWPRDLPVAMKDEIYYLYAEDGVLHCDPEVDLTATPPAVADCDGCDFTYDVEGVIRKGSVEERCNVPAYFLAPTERGRDFSLTFWAVHEYTSYYHVYTHTNQLWFAYVAGSGGPDPLSFAGSLAYDSGYLPGRATFEDGILQWTIYERFEATFADTTYVGEELCDTFVSAAPAPVTAQTGMGSLPCDATSSGEERQDVWAFEADAGAVVTVSVDTVDAATAFDPGLSLAGEDTCWLGGVDDAFSCTYPPPAFGCPAATFTAPASGTYYALVAAFVSCAGDTAGYEIGVEGARPGSLTQRADDFSPGYTATIQRYVSGSMEVEGKE